MNKKGFTLVELILVITLMAVISVLVIPNILDALSSSKQQKYESLYKLVEKNMKLYNDKYSIDLWNNENTFFDFCEGDTQGCNSGIEKLKESGSDLNLDDCVINTMTITKNDAKYNYSLTMTCGTEDKVICSRDENEIKCE
jgi:prepilin-type N-terminal cleavage/methylation domain-containing protein